MKNVAIIGIVIGILILLMLVTFIFNSKKTANMGFMKSKDWLYVALGLLFVGKFY